MDKYQNIIMGILETATFVRSGPLRFGNSWRDVALSFLPVLIVLPFNLYTLWLLYVGISDLTPLYYSIIATRYVFHSIFGLVLIFSLLYAFCQTFGYTAHYRRALCGMNWLSLVSMLIFSAPLLLVAMGLHTIEETQTFGMILSAYESAMIAFLLTYALPVRWFTGIFLAFMVFAIQYCLLALVFIP
jgi:hypothetical protein